MFLHLTISYCNCIFVFQRNSFQEYRIFRICDCQQLRETNCSFKASFFPVAYLGLSEKCISRRCSRTSLTNHSSGRIAYPVGWRASAGSQGLVWWQHFLHSSKDNSGDKKKRKWCRVVNSAQLKYIIFWVCSVFWNLQVGKRRGGLVQCAGQWLQSHISVWAVQESSWLEHSRWGWQRSETKTKPTSYCAGAAFLRRDTETQVPGLKLSKPNVELNIKQLCRYPLD